jgi:hypothetical protein
MVHSLRLVIITDGNH